MKIRIVFSIIFSFVLLLVAGAAQAAASGLFTGRLVGYNNRGNYCPQGLNRGGYGEYYGDCTDARYLESDAYTYLPIRNVKVVLTVGEYALGYATTDAQGKFTISWTWPFSSSLTEAVLLWNVERSDRRFSLVNPSVGKPWVLYRTVPISNGKTTTFPYSLANRANGLPSGTAYWGNSFGPNSVVTAFFAAELTWRSLQYSSLMQTKFTGVAIEYPTDYCVTHTDSGVSACASGSTKRVRLGTIDDVRNGFTVAHELGHVVSYLSDHHTPCGAYDFDDPDEEDDLGHHVDSQEYACAAFEEGFADFIALTALYGPGNPSPFLCLGSYYYGYCVAVVANSAEASMNWIGSRVVPGTQAIHEDFSCQAGDARREQNVMKTLWDVHDLSNEEAVCDGGDWFFNCPEGEHADELEESLDTVIDALAKADHGYYDSANNEPWNSFGNQLDDRDGRSIKDFLWNYFKLYGSPSNVAQSERGQSATEIAEGNCVNEYDVGDPNW